MSIFFSCYNLGFFRQFPPTSHHSLSFFLDIIEIHVGLGKLYAKLTEEEKKRVEQDRQSQDIVVAVLYHPPNGLFILLKHIKFKEIKAENDSSIDRFAPNQKKNKQRVSCFKCHGHACISIVKGSAERRIFQTTSFDVGILSDMILLSVHDMIQKGEQAQGEPQFCCVQKE